MVWPFGGVDAMAVTRPDPEAVRKWVAEWCAAQGVADKVADGEAVGRVAALLREGRHAQRPTAPPGDPGDP